MTTKLIFRGVYDIVGNKQVGLIVLTDEEKARQVSLVCDHNMVVQLSLRLEKNVRLEKLLPEVLWNVVKRYNDMDFMLLFSDVKDGEYITYLCSIDNSVAIQLRASDAVLLAVISGLPIMMDQQLFCRHSTPYYGAKSKVAVPLASLSREMLEEALQKAVEAEDYEKASQLRDELLRRKKDNDSEKS